MKEDAMEFVRARVTVSGRVQGVNFRASTRERARASGVVGWVRNLDDGRVEAMFEGPPAAVKQVISWCYGGPIPARVEQVEIEWVRPTGLEKNLASSGKHKRLDRTTVELRNR